MLNANLSKFITHTRTHTHNHEQIAPSNSASGTTLLDKFKTDIIGWFDGESYDRQTNVWYDKLDSSQTVDISGSGLGCFANGKGPDPPHPSYRAFYKM